MVAVRKTPTTSNYGTSVEESTFADRVDAEVESLWKCVGNFLSTISGTGNTIIASTDTTIVSALTTVASRPMFFWFIAGASNTGAVTIDIDSVGPFSIKDRSGNALTAGAITINRLHLIIWLGDHYRLVL